MSSITRTGKVDLQLNAYKNWLSRCDEYALGWYGLAGLPQTDNNYHYERAFYDGDSYQEAVDSAHSDCEGHRYHPNDFEDIGDIEDIGGLEEEGVPMSALLGVRAAILQTLDELDGLIDHRTDSLTDGLTDSLTVPLTT